MIIFLIAVASKILINIFCIITYDSVLAKNDTYYY